MADRTAPNWRQVPREDMRAGHLTGQRFARSLLAYVARSDDDNARTQALQDAIRAAVFDQALNDMEVVGRDIVGKTWAAISFLHAVIDAIVQAAQNDRETTKPLRRRATSISAAGGDGAAQIIAFPGGRSSGGNRRSSDSREESTHA